MPSTSIVTGVLLILLGIFGYVFGLLDGHASPTALIPAAFGLLLVIFGWLATVKEDLRKHLMHAAVLVAFIGFLIPAVRLISKYGEFFRFSNPSSEGAGIGATAGFISLAVLSQVAMSLICLVFVILCVKSFINARRNREI